MPQDPTQQRVVPVATHRVDVQAVGLVDHQQVVVGVEDREGNRRGRSQQPPAIEVGHDAKVQGQFLPGPHDLGDPPWYSVDAHGPLADQRSNRPSGNGAEVGPTDVDQSPAVPCIRNVHGWISHRCSVVDPWIRRGGRHGPVAETAVRGDRALIPPHLPMPGRLSQACLDSDPMSRPPAYLFTGPEHLLVRRAADQLLAELSEEAGGELDVTEVRGSDLGEDNLPDLRTASLFGIARAYVVGDAQLLPKVAAKALKREIEGRTAAATIVLLATKTQPILGLAKVVKAAGGRIDTAPPKEWEDKAWRRLVIDEFRRHSRVPEEDAVDAVLDASGLSVNIIAEKVAQAAAASVKGTTVTAQQVEQVVVGHGSRGSFAVADAMCDRKPAEALTLLRGCLDAGDHPVMILGALTYKMRQLIAVAAEIPGKEVGLSLSRPQIARLQTARRKYGPGELTAALQHLAACDLEIKSGDLDQNFAIERAVLGVASGERLPVPNPDREILR